MMPPSAQTAQATLAPRAETRYRTHKNHQSSLAALCHLPVAEASRQNIPEGRSVPNTDEQGLTAPVPAPDGARADENGAARRPRAARPRRATSDGSPAAAALGAALPDLASHAAPAAPSAPARIPRRRGTAGRTTLPAVPVVAPDLVEAAGVPVEATEPSVASVPEAATPRRRGISPENTVFVSLCFEGP